jgi:threonine synthase
VLGEGNTPLIPSAVHPGLWFKLEQCNPTGSYKDRFVAEELGRWSDAERPPLVLATSSGNTGSSLAAYSARLGIRCAIFANADAPAGKLLQMRAHGATVVRVPGFTADAAVTDAVFAALRESGLPLVVSAFRYCPEGMKGVERISHEIAAALVDGVRHVFVPVGGGGLYSAVAQGFRSSGVRVHAVQPEGCATVVEAWRRSETAAHAVSRSTTSISGLSVPTDIDATLALQRLYENGGNGIAVADQDVFDAQKRMLMQEGIYCEPAGAAAYAGYLRSGAKETSVCLVTGHGFKDPGSLEALAAESPIVEPANVRAWIEQNKEDHAG